jgi:hypothetical protein
VHIAVNIAPTLGVGGAMSYVVSQTPNPLAASAGPSHPEVESLTLSAPAESSAPPPAPGRKLWVKKATHKLVLALAKCTDAGTLLTTEEVLTLMDSEDPQEDGKYMDSLSNLVNFGVHDAIDIYNLEECFLATFGTLDRGGARNLRRFTQNKILVPLGLHLEVSPDPSIQVFEKPDQFKTIHKWRSEVDQAVGIKEEEDIEEIDDGVEIVEEDEIEEVRGGNMVVEVEDDAATDE